MAIEWLIDNLLLELREQGIDAKVTYCRQRDGAIISFEITVVGYLK